MAAELDSRCPICLDSWEEASYVMPCLHRFCYVCILRWAESKPECPLCKGRVTSILHSVRGDDDFEEHLIPPPAAPSADGHLPEGVPGHPGAQDLHHPAASQPSAAGLVPEAPVGGLQPRVWASLLQQDCTLLRPVLLWLRQELWLFFEGRRRETAAAQRLVVSCLQLYGLDEESLVRMLQGTLGPYASEFVCQLIDIIVARCGREARGRVGLEDAPSAEEEREGSPAAAPSPAASRGRSPAPSPAPSSSPDLSEAEELPSASSAALRGGPGSSPAAPIPTHGEREEPQEELAVQEEAVPGPSAPSPGREHSPEGPRRAPKRTAGSPEGTSPPSKRSPRRQQ
ncbi:opioid growth factor receptor-like [Grus japonensis]|uniref:E3 ubiquitin-protein ligase Topors n=1 Tax=Grus japonensis TaxID=30415 RepID=A0ABC9Y7S9_GRUJA